MENHDFKSISKFIFFKSSRNVLRKSRAQTTGTKKQKRQTTKISKLSFGTIWFIRDPAWSHEFVDVQVCSSRNKSKTLFLKDTNYKLWNTWTLESQIQGLSVITLIFQTFGKANIWLSNHLENQISDFPKISRIKTSVVKSPENVNQLSIQTLTS